MIVTIQKLKNLRACESQRRLFESKFGESVELSLDIIKDNINHFDIKWFTRYFLSEKQRKAYNEAVTSTLKAYDEAIAPARKAYDEAVESALKAYDEAIAPAQKAYNEAVTSILKAYDEAIAPARKAYNEAVVPAQKAYSEARASALWLAINS